MLTLLELSRGSLPEDATAPSSARPLITASARGEDLTPVIRATAAHFGGCENFEYWRLEQPQPEDAAKWSIFTTLPLGWETLWHQRQYAAIDPRIGKFRNPLVGHYPLVWSAHSHAGKSPELDSFLASAASHGIGAGVAFSLSDAQNRTVIVSPD